MESPSEGPRTMRISELSGRIQGAIKQSFPNRVWVVGELTGFERNQSRRHWFFQLTENDPSTGRTYSLDVVIWDDERRLLFGRAGKLKGDVELRDGLQIRALVQVDFPAKTGRLQLSIRDIDAAHTLGRIALDRKRLIERLSAEGLLEQQKRLALPALPLRIGLVTAADSAAFNDFVQELTAARLSFVVRFFDARMQGDATERTVCRGLQVMASYQVDVIALVRGGGSTTDLAWFDKEALVRAVASCPVPVLTGIGHEIDTSVADLAAHVSLKTPTAVAAFLVDRGRAAARAIREQTTRLCAVDALLRRERQQLSLAAKDAVTLTQGAVGRERSALASAADRARADAERRVLMESELVRAARDLIARRASQAVIGARAVVVECGRRATGPAVTARLRTARDGARELTARIAVLAPRYGDRERERVIALERRARLLDPQNVVRRGFAILRDLQGQVIKDAAAVAPGGVIEAELRDGKIVARAVGGEDDRSSASPPASPARAIAEEASQKTPEQIAKRSSKQISKQISKKNNNNNNNNASQRGRKSGAATDGKKEPGQQGGRRFRQLEFWGSEGSPPGDPGGPGGA